MSDSAARRGRVEVLAQRLRRSAARLAASHRRSELVDVIGSSQSEEDATDAVSDLLDVSPELASEVIEMPVKAFTQENVANLEGETEHLQQRLTALRSDG